jgi:hypothetical protein
VNTLADLQKKYRDPLVYTAFGAQNIGAMEAEPVVVDEDEEFFILSDGAKIRKSAEQATELSERYGEPAPAEPARAEPAVAPVEPAPINLKEEGEFDPVTRTYLLPDGTRVDEANNIVEMARGGSVQRLRKGGQPRRGYDYANAARTVGQGLTFGFGDEIEAKLRSLASRDPNAYANEVKRIRMLQERYAKANPGTAMVLEGAGMLGGSLLAPSLAGARVVGNAGRLARLGAGAADDLLQGAAYSAGKADTNRMQAVREDAPGNALIYAGMSGSSLAAKKAAQKALATNRGYRAARGAYNAVQDPLSVFRRR